MHGVDNRGTASDAKNLIVLQIKERETGELLVGHGARPLLFQQTVFWARARGTLPGDAC